MPTHAAQPPGAHPGFAPPHPEAAGLPPTGPLEQGAPGSYITDGSGLLRPGTLLGKYQIIRPLGAGGMGAVYEAVHTGIGKPVALKTMTAALSSDPRAEQRFLREAAAASRLEHPHVVDVTDFGSDHGVIYIVMELMRGEDLSALVTRAPTGLDATFVADVMLPVCAGVFAAHDKGVIHRDLKPQNIFLARTALGDVVPKVLDFGISKLIDDKVNSALTHTGSVMGTTHYLSPEQVTGQPIDGRSDEFALGVILYECLTGRRPHDGETIFTIMRAISEGRFNRPLALRPDLAPAFEAVILRAMSLRPDDRYPTVHALGRALLPFASPKGRVLWSEYFERGQTTAPTGFPPQPTSYGGAHWAATMAVPGQLGPAAGDTRSGVRPVSVMGSNELLRARNQGSAARKLAVAVLGLGAAAAAWMILGRGALQKNEGPPPQPTATGVAPPPVSSPAVAVDPAANRAAAKAAPGTGAGAASGPATLPAPPEEPEPGTPGTASAEGTAAVVPPARSADPAPRAGGGAGPAVGKRGPGVGPAAERTAAGAGSAREAGRKSAAREGLATRPAAATREKEPSRPGAGRAPAALRPASKANPAKSRPEAATPAARRPRANPDYADDSPFNPGTAPILD